jgi:DNA-binding ferritin-like protein (Dps family)
MAGGFTKIVETVTGPLEQKKRYRQYKARVERLPAPYKAAVEALQRFSYYFGHGTGDGGVKMLEDLADLFERGAADGTPVREIVGADPVEFAEAFMRNYPEGSWIIRERERLTKAIERAEATNGSEGAAR